MKNLQQKLSEYTNYALGELRKLSEPPARALKEVVQYYRSAAAVPLSATAMKLRGIGEDLKEFYEVFFFDKWSYAAAVPLSAATVAQFYLGRPVDGMYTGLASLILLSALSNNHQSRAEEPQLAQMESKLKIWKSMREGPLQYEELLLVRLRARRQTLAELPEAQVKQSLLSNLDALIAGMEERMLIKDSF